MLSEEAQVPDRSAEASEHSDVALLARHTGAYRSTRWDARDGAR